MKNKNSLHALIVAYSQNFSREEEPKEEKKGGILKFILRRFVIILSVKIFILSFGAVIILFPIILIIMIIVGIFGGNSSENNLYYGEYNDFTNHFTQELMDTPLGIPVERGRITYGFDYTYNGNQHPLNDRYLSLTLPGSTQFYSKHQGIDFAPLWSDKLKLYSPKIISTINGIILQYETFTEDGDLNNYTRVSYINDSYVTLEHQGNANNIIQERPYGNHVIVSSTDGVFYVMFAHLKSINTPLIEGGEIKRGQVIGIEGSTGNSTAQHLHYEIRYCGKNTDLKKGWRDCWTINPLAFVEGQEFTYLGFKELPKENSFTAGDKDIAEVIQEDNSEELKQKKEIFCRQSLILNTNCDILFPIYEFSQNNVLFPLVGEGEREIIAKRYISQEYGENSQNLEKIALLEGITFSQKTFYSDLGKTLSYGKYGNKENIYKIRNISLLNQEEKAEIEKIMSEDLGKIINTYNSLAAEEFFNKYYNAPQYLDGKNPYVYNFIDSSNIFMEILSPSGEKLGKFNKDGVLTIYLKSK